MSDSANVVTRIPSDISAGRQRKDRTASGGMNGCRNRRPESVPSVDIMTFTLWITFAIFSMPILLGELFFLPNNPLEWCTSAQLEAEGYDLRKEYRNPDANTDPCYHERTVYLLGWNRFECDFARRMIYAVILGSCVGYERRSADRPAGIRTMSLVSLGSAIFTMAGQFAFRSSTQEWDAARVSAAIPAGVGFLGSALVWKETTGEKENRRNHVHGIATATSVWLSASVGIAAGGALWVISAWTVVLAIFVLRLGPQLAFVDDVSVSRKTSASVTLEGDWDADDGKINEDEQGDIACDTFNDLKYESVKGLDQEMASSVRLNSATGVPLSRSTRRLSATQMSILQQKKQAVNFHSD